MSSNAANNQQHSSKLSIVVKVLAVIFLLNLVADRIVQIAPVYSLGGNFSVENTFMLSLKLPFLLDWFIGPDHLCVRAMVCSEFLKEI